jgi:hypothetical protein
VSKEHKELKVFKALLEQLVFKENKVLKVPKVRLVQ